MCSSAFLSAYMKCWLNLFFQIQFLMSIWVNNDFNIFLLSFYSQTNFSDLRTACKSLKRTGSKKRIIFWVNQRMLKQIESFGRSTFVLSLNKALTDALLISDACFILPYLTHIMLYLPNDSPLHLEQRLFLWSFSPHESAKFLLWSSPGPSLSLSFAHTHISL